MGKAYMLAAAHLIAESKISMVKITSPQYWTNHHEYANFSRHSFSNKFMNHTLKIQNLHAEIDGQKIIKGFDLTIKSGEIHVIMGPNGSGKSTLCKIVMGHPSYEITEGQILFDDKEISDLEPNERANLGIFLGFQHPFEIPGVTLGNFLRQAHNANQKATNKEFTPASPVKFMQDVKAELENLKMEASFAARFVNENFSGGEKKRAEIAQMNILKPNTILLDEIDSGLDIDALKVVAEGINKNFQENNPAILIITHYQRILNYIVPHHVHIMHDGKIVKSGDHKLATTLEETGYEQYITN
jgi:Fe-S cluster assembly ATP-binding protein